MHCLIHQNLSTIKNNYNTRQHDESHAVAATTMHEHMVTANHLMWGKSLNFLKFTEIKLVEVNDALIILQIVDVVRSVYNSCARSTVSHQSCDVHCFRYKPTLIHVCDNCCCELLFS